MAHKVILPPKKNYIPQFLKQRDINSYFFPKVLFLLLGSRYGTELIIGTFTSVFHDDKL
jgi:hypothetical protein